MHFKNCPYYEKSIQQEHCAFDKVCNYDCYFVHKLAAESYEELLEQHEELEYELDEVKTQLNDEKVLLDNLDTYEQQYEEMMLYMKTLVDTLYKYEKVEIPIPDITCYEWHQEIYRYVQNKGTK